MAPPADIPKISAGASGAGPPVAPPPARDAASGQGGAAGPRAAALDIADIRPLDVGGALQILVAEIRAALDEALLAALRSPATSASPRPLAALAAAAPLETPEQAAHAVLETLLQTLPAPQADPQQLPQAQLRIDSAVQSGMQRAIDIVEGWQGQGVAAAAPDAAHAAVQLIANALGAEVLNLAWLKPEWAQFLPRLERYRRRRSRLRRRLADPDDREGEHEDDQRR